MKMLALWVYTCSDSGHLWTDGTTKKNTKKNKRMDGQKNNSEVPNIIKLTEQNN